MMADFVWEDEHFRVTRDYGTSPLFSVDRTSSGPLDKYQVRALRDALNKALKGVKF